MTIYAEVSVEMKSAMRARDKERLTGLRGIRAAFILANKEAGTDTLSDEVCLHVLAKLAKQRKDSIAAYTEANRPELVAQEEHELAVIGEFLPALADPETTRTWVEAAIAQTGATSRRDFGRVMGAVMKGHKGEADAQLVRGIAQELLG